MRFPYRPVRLFRNFIVFAILFIFFHYLLIANSLCQETIFMHRKTATPESSKVQKPLRLVESVYKLKLEEENESMNILDVPNITKDHLFKTDTGLEKTIEVMKYKSVKDSAYGGNPYCEGNIEAIRWDFLYMKDVVLNITKQFSKQKGGEMLMGVLGQKDKDEVINLRKGLFKVPCNNFPKLKSYPPLFDMIEPVYNDTDKFKSLELDHIPNFTVMIRRSYYSQMYFTFNELYLTYLTVRLFNKNSKNTTILFRDAHPFFKLDYIWKYMFKDVVRIGRLPNSVLIQELVSVVVGPLPFHQAMRVPPFISDFKEHMYQSHGINELDRIVCPRSLNDINITLILRQNFHANPQWKEGKIYRKIKNQLELISFLSLNLQRAKFTAVQLDNMNVEEQVRIICYTNILIAIHGAGLSYTTLLRAGSSLIELFPSNNHFEQIAHWAKVHYISHDGPHPYQEYIFIPPELALKFINDSVRRISENCKLKPHTEQVL